ncbi:7TM-DISM domain-containing protein [Crenobacter sp. SG2305]|uniref:hybrid sensor histidine kinase/response regulator n=1 Tax=Crenobacter oryzisoli TaxID=3056844 RepID=UPI0025AB4FDA|nr:7TM-DISM domain-containing protein [Crenobacter sp. SG2305]MDN0081826.1 7TM-DISM domain-containing protein [Crenobacter sp. SG2305]
MLHNLYRRAWLLLLCLSWGIVAHAAPLVVHDKENGRTLQPFVELMEDAGRSATLTEVLEHGRFVPATPAQLAPGYSRSAFWLRVRLFNPSPYPRTAWIEVGSPRLEEVTFYQLDAGRWQKLEAGTRHPFTTRPLDTSTPVFPVTLRPGETRQIVWRVASSAAMSIMPSLWTPEAFRAEEATNALVRGLELGSLTVLGLYSLMLFLSLGHRGYAFHGASALTFVVYELGMTGLGFRFLWPEATGWATRLVSLSINVSLVCFLLFFREFLETRTRMPRWDKFMLVLMAGLAVSTVLSQFVNYTVGARLGTQLGLLITVALPLFCFWTLSRGPATSWAYTLATFTISLGNLTRVLENLGLRAPDRLSSYGVPLAGVLCTFLLLVAFMQQMRRVRQQKDQATASLLAFREKEREELEQLVAARTEELNTALKSAKQANQAKSSLLAHISHDLRAPLSTIIGYARLLMQPDTDRQKCRRAIEKNARHQLELIDELIDFSRAELGEIAICRSPGYWYAFIDGITNDARQLAQAHDNHFVLDSASDVPPVLFTDFKRLRQILSNLISNATKFTLDGTIRLAIRRCDGGGDPHSVTLCFEIHDTGIGMSPGTLSRLFQPFERGDNTSEYEGTGLGLVIARSLVHKLGGELTVTSQLGEGSCFAFTLNVEVRDEAALLAAAEPSSSPLLTVQRNHTVLVADDVPESLALTADWLRSAGHNVLEAADGDKALWLLDRHTVDVVVSDQRMPNRDGWVLLFAIREMPAPLPVLLYSAEPAQRPKAYSDLLCFDAELLKPADPDQLLTTIDALLSAPKPAPLRPGTDHLATLRELVITGRISDIETWAQQLEQDSPVHADFARQVARAAMELDIDTLEHCSNVDMTAPV